MRSILRMPLLMLTGGLIMSSGDAAGAEPIEQNSERWTTWHGIYTESEADSGWYGYGSRCARCHGENLEGGSGPPLVGDRFMESWREDTLDSLFRRISKMPPQGPWLDDQTYLDILGYMLQANGYPSGSYRLSTDTLETVWIEGMNGPEPVPDRAIVEVVGCLAQASGEWILTKASEPVRARQSEKTNPEDLKAAESKPLGNYEFLLTNFYMLGAFDPDPYLEHKMLAKGALNRRSDGDRISLTGLGMVADSCEW